MQIFQELSIKVKTWAREGYTHDHFQGISEILEWAHQPDVSIFHLRAPQLRALETYWYLRLVEKTPHLYDLYKRLFTSKNSMLEALNIPEEAFRKVDFDFTELEKNIRNDTSFVKEFRLEAVRETLTLEYPSYILALAMGAGKTVLIGSIFATEFAMAQEYPDSGFVENALVFAPGKTIIESLRELAKMSYEAVLPPRFYKSFAATLKLTFTRDGDPDIPVTRGSSWNVIVTNTEKIRIQKETIRKGDMPSLFGRNKEDEARTEIANLRLQAIASLPRLAIFSDEAHHTYGQAMDEELKKVRKTVDYLGNPHPDGSHQRDSHKTQLVCVVNTTGTPFFKRQPLRDVVIWYGLSEGIRDGILKEVAGNIYGVDFHGNEKDYITFIIEDFFKTYGDVHLPDGTPAKLAIFFPQTNDVSELRPTIEKTLMKLGLPPTLILEHHTRHDSKTDFDRFQSKDSPHRIALLVDRGVEGWNVPALFACALARQLKSSNNFVLQAASRCLRQIPGNTVKARIYLSLENKSILDRQLQETYGESFAEILGGKTHSKQIIITLRKLDLPPIMVRKTVRQVCRIQKDDSLLHLTLPVTVQEKGKVVAFTPSEKGELLPTGDVFKINSTESIDLYTVAQDLARNYRLDPLDILEQLHLIYQGEYSLPAEHFTVINRQIEDQVSQYKTSEEIIEVALALIKKEGFAKEIDETGTETYTAEISYPIDRESLLTHFKDWKDRAGNFGFQYTPYCFDSKPEKNFFEVLLEMLNQNPDNVEDIYYTGALTDTRKTDFLIEYRGMDGRMHNYTPDFIIKRKDGKCLIVEIKSDRERDDSIDGMNGAKAMATRKWESLNPDKLKYQIIFVKQENASYEAIEEVRNFI